MNKEQFSLNLNEIIENFVQEGKSTCDCIPSNDAQLKTAIEHVYEDVARTLGDIAALLESNK